MFHTLVASDPRTRPGVHRLFLSVGFHAVAVAGAVALTRQPAPAVPAPLAEPALLLVAPEVQQKSLPALRDHITDHRAPVLSWDPLLQVPDLSPAMLPPTVATVSDLLNDVSLRSAPPGSGSNDTTLLAAGELWTATSVDDPVGVIEQPPVEYPPALAQAAISGRVELEYVVDTLGRVEPASIRALTSTRPEFEAVARAAILGSRYRPARLHGRVVRQLVRQTLSFRSER